MIEEQFDLLLEEIQNNNIIDDKKFYNIFINTNFYFGKQNDSGFLANQNKLIPTFTKIKWLNTYHAKHNISKYHMVIKGRKILDIIPYGYGLNINPNTTVNIRLNKQEINKIIIYTLQN